MTQYKMIALDMDGTLLNKQSEISPANLEALHACLDRGINVCLATGRGIYNVSPFIDQIGVELPLVTANGSEVWEDRSRLHSRIVMDAALVVELHSLAVKHNVWFWGSASDRVYNRDSWCDDPYEVEWLKFGYYTEDADVLAELRKKAEEMDSFEITNSHPANLEFNPKGVNKAAGLEIVCELLGMSMDQVIAVGDSLNDIAMIRAAGLGVAMGNAQDIVKETADKVTLHHDDDGVAHIIQQILT